MLAENSPILADFVPKLDFWPKLAMERPGLFLTEYKAGEFTQEDCSSSIHQGSDHLRFILQRLPKRHDPAPREASSVEWNQSQVTNEI